MVKVVSYLKGIPSSNNNPEKPRALIEFIKGVQSIGDTGIVSNNMNLIPADVAVIQGFVHQDSKNAPHLEFRKSVLHFQKANNKRTIIIDSNLFLYRDPNNTKGYLRYSYDSIFPNTGEYCNDKPDPQRWEIIKNDLGFNLKPWRTNGTHILICLQRNGGWSMKGLPVTDFCHKTIKKIRKYTDRPIIVRVHPGDKKSDSYAHYLTGKDVRLSTNKSLIDDLQGAWASVIYNSSPSVASAIEGIPCFILDPEYSQSTPIANLELSKIEDPIMPERLEWVQRLAQCHWKNNDLVTGAAWRHMKNYL